MNESYLYSDITESIIKCYYKVYNNKLGYGFLEKVYEKALLIELEKEGFKCLVQCPIDVYYESEKVGYYLADIIVNGKIIIEI